MNLSELQSKNIITNEGKLIGNIIDIIIKDGVIEYLVIEKSKFFISMFSSRGEIKIRWNDIKTIGDDVIIVNNV